MALEVRFITRSRCTAVTVHERDQYADVGLYNSKFTSIISILN